MRVAGGARLCHDGSGLLRTTWRTVTGIVARVVADLAGKADLLEGLRRIGIDELAHRKGQRYITVIVCHDTGRIVWAKEGRNKAVVEAFFDALGALREKMLMHVSADGAEWIHIVVLRPSALLPPYSFVSRRRLSIVLFRLSPIPPIRFPSPR